MITLFLFFIDSVNKCILLAFLVSGHLKCDFKKQNLRMTWLRAKGMLFTRLCQLFSLKSSVSAGLTYQPSDLIVKHMTLFCFQTFW